MAASDGGASAAGSGSAGAADPDPVRLIVDPPPAAAVPALGAPPRLAWLPLDILTVDARYQRSIQSRRSQRLIERIVRDFRWGAFGAALVAPDLEDDARYAVIDGQHRVAAARQRGGIAAVPCIVVEAADAAAAARAFVQANRDRVTMTPLAIHHALLTAGDPDARDLQETIDEAGLSVPRYAIGPNDMKAGQTLALGTIRTLMNRDGRDAAIEVLTILAEAYRDKKAGIRSNVIRALALLRREGALPDRARLVRFLAETNPELLQFDATAQREDSGDTLVEALATVVQLGVAEMTP